ncbi:MAG TPA: HNH endonuclease signature motif containing protein [Candidatus Binatia bacterium]|nr:HNH endonuclease signature motif containing protein [Candidatus Binatia bacterium]
MCKATFEKRFWSNVARAAPDQCWLWTGAVGKHGYGKTSWNNENWRTHRVSWVLTNGIIPEGLYVCHKCDVKLCCNPHHLFLGTPKDNAYDMIEKGRKAQVNGEQIGSAALSEKDVLEILSAPRAYGIGRQLARKFGVSPATISDIRHGRSWNHVTGIPLPKNRRQLLRS